MKNTRFRIWDKKHNRWFHGSTDPQAIATQTDAISLFGETIVMGGLLSDQHEDDIWEDDPDIEGSLDIIDWLEVCVGTGLKDKNGREIFGGDIVKFKDRLGGAYNEPVSFGPIYDGEGHFHSTFMAWRTTFTLYDMDADNANKSLFDIASRCEVIGNIYESPELLEEAKMTTEAQLQIQVADYLRWQYPGILFHSDYGSGVKLTARQAAVQKRQNGGRKGWPDMFIAESRSLKVMGVEKVVHNGLFLELKREGTRLKKKDGSWANPHIAEQAVVLDELRLRFYKAEFAVGFEEAKKIIDEYLGG